VPSARYQPKPRSRSNTLHFVACIAAEIYTTIISMRTIVTALAVVAWFASTGLLWFLRPSDVLWLLGSAVLGVVFFGGFLWYLIARDDPVSGL